MALKINRDYFIIGVLMVLTNITSCGGNMAQSINSEDLKLKWDDAINNSSESWWYAGTEKTFHFIAIKRPYSSITYKISSDSVQLKGINKFEFTDNSENWVNIKSNDIEF